MNYELLLRFVDVQTRLITPICQHYAEHVWQNILKKEGFVVKAGWPIADTPDPTLRAANKYLLDSMVLMRKLLHKQGSDVKKAKKGAVVPATLEENKLSVGLIYVNEKYDGWREQCLRVLQTQFEPKSCSFASDEQIIETLKNYSIGQDMDLKQIQKLCMPFIKFKKDEAQKVGLHALELKIPFSELEVLELNSEPIKRQLGLEHVEILLASDESSANKAGPHISLIRQNPPSPGHPTAIFLSKSEVQGQSSR